MTFEQFLFNNILPIFTNIISWLGYILNSLMGNYIFMIIVYIGIITLIINVIMEIVDIIRGKMDKTEKDKGN